jgi:hypothetical protein
VSHITRSVVATGLAGVAAWTVPAFAERPGWGPVRRVPAVQEAGLAPLLAAAGAYVDDYERQCSAIVALEEYSQTIRQMRSDPGGVFTLAVEVGRRELRSDMLVLNLREGGWLGFRDVFEVEGPRAVLD